MIVVACAWLTHLHLPFRHKLDEAMLTDPWDSMKYADLGGYSTPWIRLNPLSATEIYSPVAVVSGCLLGSKGSPGSVS